MSAKTSHRRKARKSAKALARYRDKHEDEILTCADQNRDLARSSLTLTSKYYPTTSRVYLLGQSESE